MVAPLGPPSVFSLGGRRIAAIRRGGIKLTLFAKACPSCNYRKAHTRIFAHALCKDLTGPLIVPWSSEVKFCFLLQCSTMLHCAAACRVDVVFLWVLVRIPDLTLNNLPLLSGKIRVSPCWRRGGLQPVD